MNITAKSGHLYKGKPIEDLSREELLECVLLLMGELQQSLERERHTLQVWKLSDQARKTSATTPYPK